MVRSGLADGLDTGEDVRLIAQIADGQTGALRRWINFSISIARKGVSIFNATPARVSPTITAIESSHAND